MKKLYIVMVLLMASIVLRAQDQPPEKKKPKYYKHIEIGVGGGYSNIQTSRNANTGMFCMSFSLFNFYFEIGTNFASGKGKQMNWSSGWTYKTDKTNVTSFIVGWNINALKNKLIVTPKIGYTSAYDIYNDPLAFDTWYKSQTTSALYLGAAVKYYFHKNVGIGLSAALTMPVSAQLTFRF